MSDLTIYVDGKAVHTIMVPAGAVVEIRTTHPGVRLETVSPDQNTEVSISNGFVFWCPECNNFVSESHENHTVETYRNDDDWNDWD